MIEIIMNNVSTKLKNIPSSLIDTISNELSFTIKGFGFSKTTNLFDVQNQIIPTGLVPRLVKLLIKKNIFYKIIDERVKHKPNASYSLNDNYIARDYQQEIIDRATSREIIQAATGAGKTFIMYSLIRKFSVKPTIVIAPKVSLAEQIKKEFESFSGQEIGICTGFTKNIKDITICTPQSVPKKLLKEAKAIFFDEAHNIPSHTIYNVANQAINAYYRIGVSATPWRDGGDDLLIEAVLSIRKPHLSINASKLIKKGKLTPCNIFFIRYNKEFQWQGNYNETYRIAISENEERNNIIVKLAKKASFQKNRTTLILINQIKHGEILLNKLSENTSSKEYIVNGERLKINEVEFLSGRDSSNRREAVFQSIRDGFTKILIGSTIADEGLDLPPLDCLILAGSGKSSTRAFQRIGRVLRLYKNKKNAIIFDFADATKTFNYHYKVRKALYETEPLWNINYI
mgnify:CR=1 FL=1